VNFLFGIIRPTLQLFSKTSIHYSKICCRGYVGFRELFLYHLTDLKVYFQKPLDLGHLNYDDMYEDQS